MISISTYIYDDYTGEPMPFEKIYMQIVDDKGVEVWPLTVLAVEADGFNKLISTAELEPGMYTVRISPSKKLSPMGASTFTIEKSPALGVVPLIPAAILALPTALTIDKISKDIVQPPDLSQKIALLIYETEKDTKVCPICLPHQGKSFLPDDPNLIKIGPPQLGGETHYGCRCHYEAITIKQIQETTMTAAYQAHLALEAYHIAMVVKAAKMVN